MNVALIDIGSNSIKLLVVERESFFVVCEKFCECRLSNTEKSRGEERILPENADVGVKNVQNFVALAKSFAAEKIVLVGTSFLRRAVNSAEFCGRIYAECGHALRIISGEDEARYLLKGVLTAPGFAEMFKNVSPYVFDLGGGSLELVAKDACGEVRAESFELGPIPVSRALNIDLGKRFSQESVEAVRDYVFANLRIFEGKKLCANTSPVSAIFCAGALAVADKICSALRGRSLFVGENSEIDLAQLGELARHLSNLDLCERAEIPNMPKSRADILPVSLIVVQAIISFFGLERVCYSNRNMRYGAISSFCESEMRDFSEG